MSSHAIISGLGGAVASATTPDARMVFLMGMFNGWNPASHPMKRSRAGEWTLALDIPSGGFEYTLGIDGNWCCEPGCDRAFDGCPGCAANGYGPMNRVLVTEDPATRPSRRRPPA